MCKALFTYAEDLVISLNPALAFVFPETKRIKTICHIHVTCVVVPVILPEKNMKPQFPVAIHIPFFCFLLLSVVVSYVNFEAPISLY
jgi:hypothetical protein